MRQIVYISTTTLVDDAVLRDILVASERNNIACGITGILLTNGRNFLQLVEGEQVDLMRLMTRLAHDRRHSGVIQIADIAITERAFPDWTMQLLRLGSSVEQRRAQIEAVIPGNLDPVVRGAMMNFARLS